LRGGGKPYFAEVAAAAAKLAAMEDSAVAEVLLSGGRVSKASSWDVPGSAVAEVAKAVAELYRAYVPEPYVPFVGPGRYAKPVAVEERTCVIKLTRVRSLVKDVAVVPQLPEDAALVMSTSPAVVDLAVSVDVEATYLGPDEAGHNLLLRETFAVRLKNPEGAVVLRYNPRFSTNGYATYPLRSVTSPETREGPGGVPRRRGRFEQLCRHVVATYVVYRQTGREAGGAFREVRGARAGDRRRDLRRPKKRIWAT